MPGYKNMKIPSPGSKKEKRKLLIALDYDECITEDIDFWIQFIKLAMRFGHEVVVVTSRYQKNAPEIQRTIGYHAPIVCTEQNPKRAFCEEHQMFFDIWIDNRPETI